RGFRKAFVTFETIQLLPCVADRSRTRSGAAACPSPKYHPIPKCLAWASCNLARRRYITFPKLLKLKVKEFWRRTTQYIKDDLCSVPYRFGDGNSLMMAPDGLSDRSLQLLV